MSSWTQAQKVVARYFDSATNSYIDNWQQATESSLRELITLTEAQGWAWEPIESLATSYTLNVWDLIGWTITNTHQIDWSYLTFWEDSSNWISVDIEFIVSGWRPAENFNMIGRYQGGASHYVEVQAYNHTTLGFDTISTAINRLNNQTSDQAITCTLTDDHTDISWHCKIRLIHQVTTYNSAHRLYIDHVNVYYSVVWATKIQNTDNVLINPAMEDGNLQTLAQKDFATQTTLATMNAKMPTNLASLEWQLVIPKSVDLASSWVIHTPSAWKKIRLYKFATTLDADVTSLSFKWNNWTPFTKFLSIKSWWLYWSNFSWKYIEWAVDEPLKCDIVWTANTTTNIEYLEI